nr:glycosyltransferase family 4 protein [uncultured Sellimonas sp.]
MNLLFLDSYFEPETIAYTHLEKDLLEGLVKENNKIQIICPTPTRGVSAQIREEYRSRRNEKLYNGRVKVRRFWAPQEGKNPIIRAFRYFWCNFQSYQVAMRVKNVDLVFSNSTPPTQGMLSAMVAKKLSKKYKKKVPFVYNLQDIFPDSLVNTGMTKKGSFLWKAGRKIENYTYENADKIIVISEGFKRNIMAKGVPEEKIEVISNWIDLDSVHPVSREDNKLISEFAIDSDKFLVVYAGNFGAAQGADVVLKAAEKLKSNKDIQFVIFGGGAYFEEAKKEADKLDNVFIHELMPANRISEVYSLGDVALITCKPGTGNAGMPSKTWSIMACNTPIIASFDTDSDLADVIRDSGAGMCVEPGNVEALVNEISLLPRKNILKYELRDYVHNHADRRICVGQYINLFTPLNH